MISDDLGENIDLAIATETLDSSVKEDDINVNSHSSIDRCVNTSQRVILP